MFKNTLFNCYYYSLVLIMFLLCSNCTKQETPQSSLTLDTNSLDTNNTLENNANSITTHDSPNEQKESQETTTPLIPESEMLAKNNLSLNTDTIGIHTYQEADLRPEKMHQFNFEVENKTGKPLYTVCFSYLKRKTFAPWRWYKTKTYAIAPNEVMPITIETRYDEQDIKHSFGVLGVFATHQEADEATYELLPDSHKLDLDLLSKISSNRITIDIEKYGLNHTFYDYDFVEKTTLNSPNFSFSIRNNTGKKIYTCCFTYEDHTTEQLNTEAESRTISGSVWRFYKTNILCLNPGDLQTITIDHLASEAKLNRARGYLGVFNEDELALAEAATFETLPQNKKINLGQLSHKNGSTITLNIQKYGISNDIVDFTIKPIQRINMKKIIS